MRSLYVLGLLALVACGGGGTEPIKPTGPISLSILAGDAQRDTVTKQLPTALSVVATQGINGNITLHPVDGLNASVSGNSVPLPNIIVNFRTDDPSCGKPFAGSQITDANGQAKEIWILGTRAGDCDIKAVAVDRNTGAPLTFDTFKVTALPGPVDYFVYWQNPNGEAVSPGEVLDLHPKILGAVDQFNNKVTDLPTPSFAFRSNGVTSSYVTSWTVNIPNPVPEYMYVRVGGYTDVVRLVTR